MSDAPKAPGRRLPVLWKSGDSQVKSSAIVHADEHDVASFGDPNVKTCGSCRHFRGPEKDRPVVGKFVAEAVLEHGWQKRFLGHPPEQLGRCNENSAIVTGPHSKACDRYNASNGRLR